MEGLGAEGEGRLAPGTLAALGCCLLLTLYAGGFKVLSATRFGKDAVLLHLLSEAPQQAVETLPVGNAHLDQTLTLFAQKVNLGAMICDP